jgi:magnesium transporter
MTAEPAVEPGAGKPGVTCVVFDKGQASGTPTELSEISEILKEKGKLVWFDVVDPKPRDLTLLEQEFHLHPLAIEDAIAAHQRSKIESYGNYYFIVIHGATVDGQDLTLHEIAIFAGRNFLVTVRHDPPYPLEEIVKRWEAHPEHLHSEAGYLLYTILDTVVDGYLPVADMFQERVDALEAFLFERSASQSEVLPQIFRMKKQAQLFRRAAFPMREILNPLIREDLSLYSHDESLYFRDVYDHTVLIVDQLDGARDLVNSSLEIQLSVVANRQNEVAKQLTIIATIFLPLSFIVGFFGQNFAWLVAHIGGEGTFTFLGLGTELLAVVATLLFFKLRGWF